MSSLRLGLVGAAGRMGKEIVEITQETPKQWKLEFANSKIEIAGFKTSRDDVNALAKSAADVVIDFSSPEALRALLKALTKSPKPLVSGTTGITDADMKALKALAKKAPVFWAPNTSLGVATLKQALRSLAAVADYDFQVEEVHHRFKKDAPSGTAKLLKTEVDKVTRKTSPTALSMRGGGVPGLHRVWAFGPEEWLCFEHMALQRKVFARGAVQVARWIVDQKPGFYSMDDYLSEKN